MKLLNPLPQRLDTGATATFAGLLAGDGTAAAPSIAFASDTNTGFYHGAAADEINVSNAGVKSLQFLSDGRIYGAQGNNYLQMSGAGLISLTASGTNQNITLTPSGTGYVSVSASEAANGLQIRSASTPNRTLMLARGSTFGSIQAQTDSVGYDFLCLNPAGGNVLIGSVSNSGVLLQIGTNTTTSAGGMVFGTDTQLYRIGPAALRLDAPAGDLQFQLARNGTLNGRFLADGATLYVQTELVGMGMIFKTGAATTALTLDSSQNATFAASVNVLNTAAIRWTSWTQMLSPLDGVIRFCNAAGTDFNRLQFGGTTASFPAIKRSGTEIHARFADDSAFAPFMASAFYSNNGDYFLDSTGTAKLRRAAGTPEGNVTAPVGSLYLRSDGGASTTLYIKESGTGNTGWVAK